MDEFETRGAKAKEYDADTLMKLRLNGWSYRELIKEYHVSNRLISAVSQLIKN